MNFLMNGELATIAHFLVFFKNYFKTHLNMRSCPDTPKSKLFSLITPLTIYSYSNISIYLIIFITKSYLKSSRN